MKIFVREPGRDVVERAVRESARIATSVISYAEARAAFARLMREESLTAAEHRGVVEALDERWNTYERLSVDEDLARLAGDFAQRHVLRGYDAVQLASAYTFRQRFSDLQFLAFDYRLNEAARKLLTLYGEVGSPR